MYVCLLYVRTTRNYIPSCIRSYLTDLQVVGLVGFSGNSSHKLNPRQQKKRRRYDNDTVERRND